MNARRASDFSLKQVLRTAPPRSPAETQTRFDQCPATPDTVLRRSRLLGRRQTGLILLGDDDLLSVALALLGARKRIVVVDLDPRVLRTIRRVAPGGVETVRHDLRNGLPARLVNRFDEAFTDPPYTIAGQLLFLHRAVLSLRRSAGARAYVCVSRQYMTPAELEIVWEFMEQAGFELTRAYGGFNRYRAPADVQLDLRQRGSADTGWLISDLFQYERRHVLPVPALPNGCSAHIYDYNTAGA